MKKLLTLIEVSFIFAILYIFLGWHRYIFLHVISLLLGLPGAIIFLFDILRSDVDEIPHGYLADIIRYIRKKYKKIFFILFLSFFILSCSSPREKQKIKKERRDWRSVSIAFNIEEKNFKDSFVLLDKMNHEIKKIEGYGDGTRFLSASIEEDAINPLQNAEGIKKSILREIFFHPENWKRERNKLGFVKISHKTDPNLVFAYTRGIERWENVSQIYSGKYEGKISFSRDEAKKMLQFFEKEIK